MHPPCILKTTQDGCTPLILAAAWDHKECMELLLDHGAQPNVADTDSRTSLYWTARKGFRDSMALLLDRGGQESIDKPDGFGESPLQVAAAQGHSDCVTLLLDRGANVEWHEVWSSPITAAAISSPLAATDGLPYILVRFHSPSCLPTSLVLLLSVWHTSGGHDATPHHPHPHTYSLPSSLSPHSPLQLSGIGVSMQNLIKQTLEKRRNAAALAVAAEAKVAAATQAAHNEKLMASLVRDE